MTATFDQSEASLGAGKIVRAIRTELEQHGCRREDIALDWFPDPRLAPADQAPELRAVLADGGHVRQMFSREELEVSCEQLERESVLAKINLVVQSLQAGLP
jgi:hypothetical protein